MRERPRDHGAVSPLGTPASGRERSRGQVGLALLLGCALTLAGCTRCSDEPRVPFKLKPAAPVDAAGASAGPDASAPLPTVFAQAVDQPLLGGAPLPIARVRAVLERDLDADGDLDALVVSEDDSQRARLQVALRDPLGFGAPLEVSGFTPALGSGCALASAQLDALSATKAAVSLGYLCSDAPTPSTVRSSLTLLSLEPSPRVHERIEVLGASATGEPPLMVGARSEDVDGDGHDDVRVLARVPGAPDADALPLVWLDRPSGLVRDGREPEATLQAWASATSTLAQSAPDQAQARAALALSLQRALCREQGAPQLAVSGAPGVACGAPKSAASLLVTVVSAHARRGELLPAFDAYRALRKLDPRPADKVLEQAGAALQKLPSRAGLSLRPGPRVEPVTTPRIHLPSARFLGDATLLVHRLSPVLYDLERAEETAAPSTSDALVRDPSGQLIATAIERTCEGLSVRIERAPPAGSDYVLGPPVAMAVLAPVPSAPGCTRAASRPDDGGYSLLGWAPQGLVAVRGSEVRLVPLSAEGRPSGPARLLDPTAPRPAPLPAGLATPDGARYVEPTPYGVLVYGPSSSQVELWRPEGYGAVAKGPLEAAISPSGSRVALIAGGSVHVLEAAPAVR